MTLGCGVLNKKESGGFVIIKASVLKRARVYDKNKEYNFQKKSLKKKTVGWFFKQNRIKNFINHEIGRSYNKKIIILKVKRVTRKMAICPYFYKNNVKVDNLLKLKLWKKLKTPSDG